MVLTGRVFDNVFLMRGGGGGGGGGQNNVLWMPNKERVSHQLIVWSERQIGRRRTSSSGKTKPVRPDYEGKRPGGGGATGWQRKFVHRNMRDVGGLDRKPPKSPWDLLSTKDPLRWRQWYLGPGGGMHLNVTGLWEVGIKGAGVSVAILDDGVELTHLDLALNYDPAASWDLLDADPDPTPSPWSRHGTQLAGIIAATQYNGLCGMGVAPWSGVGAVRMLGYVVWDATEAAALAYEREHVDVYVAAWGPVDTGTVMEGPGKLAARALREGIALGRGGRGSIYVWASGNGGFVGDDCNADGYANSVYTLTVSGSTRGGHAPDYAETCAASFVSTYSGDADEDDDFEEEQVNGVVTTDTGGVCTESFRGSSVSAAMVAGVCALAIDINPELKWRDLQHLMVQAATPHNPLSTQWSTNSVGLRYSYYFGFGSLDAGKLVELARKWKSVPPAFRCYFHAGVHDLPLVPGQRLVLPLSVSGCQVVQTEHVQVNLSVSAKSRNQVEIMLESPGGTKSTLLPRRPLDLSPYGIYNHPLLTVHMWGEDPRGTWKLHLTYHNDSVLEPFGGKRLINVSNTLHNLTLIIHGTQVPISQATTQHYYYNSSQLLSLLRKENNTRTLVEDALRPENPRQIHEEGVRIETQHWASPVTPKGTVLSYLFCVVHARVPEAVSSVTWQRSDGAPVDHVVRRLSGRGAQAVRRPTLMLVREVRTTDGNFTCRVSHGGDVLTKTIEVTGNYSSVPEVTEATSVSVEGGTVVLACPGLAPILRSTWIFEGRRLRTSRRMVVGEQELIIRGVVKDDLGVYRCQVRSARLHYSHTMLVTLLLARGPSTLITHYAIDLHPSPIIPATAPPSCTCGQNHTNTEDLTTPATEERQHCPPPYESLEDHCVMVAPGAARSWEKARSQCRRLEGDLLVIKNATLLLALMRLFHSQGLSNTSFWVGGERQGVGGEWAWVDGSAPTPGGPLWYPTLSGRPKEMPPARRHSRVLHTFRSSASASRRPLKKSFVRGARRPPSQRQRLGKRDDTSLISRPITWRTGSAAPRTATTTFTTSSERLVSFINPIRQQRGVKQLPSQSYQETSAEGDRETQSSVKRPEMNTAQRVRPMQPSTSAQGHRDAPRSAHNAPGGVRRPGAQQPRLSSPSGIVEQVLSRASGEQQPQQRVVLQHEASPRQRAICLHARLRHFLASCWAGARLRALCQHRGGA